MRRGAAARGRGGYNMGRATGNASLRAQMVSSQQTHSVRRLQKDMKELKDSPFPLVNVSAAPTDENFFVWHANLRGPESTAFYGGVFHIEITFPQNYPVSPPSIRLMTTIPHPNVFGNTLCLDMLQPRVKSSSLWQGWTSAYTVEAILVQLQSFLFEVPRSKRDIQLITDAGSVVQSVNDSMQQPHFDETNKYKKAVDLANEYQCDVCRHRGPIEAYPPFPIVENIEAAFTILRDPKVVLQEEFLCYHSRAKLPEVALGIGVSMSRLPRTGEIRSVTPTLDLLSLKAFTKQKIRKSVEGERFTHWLPLYFGEKQPFEVTIQEQDPVSKEYIQKTQRIDPHERFMKLFRHSLCFIAKGSTTKTLNAEMVMEVMPKLIITHMVEMAGERKHISILALRRLVNFVRLFRIAIDVVPGVKELIDGKLKAFKEDESLRVKDHCGTLGDLLAMAIVSDEYSLTDFLDAYLEEQLDRQAFWVIRVVPELDHTDEKYKGKQVVLEDARANVCYKTGAVGFAITMLFYTLTQTLYNKFGGDLKSFEGQVDDNFGCLPQDVEYDLQAKFKSIQRVESFQSYYEWLGKECPDHQALGQRLHKAISNSKAKKYHGSSEHMNELPKIEEQTKDYILQEPSPFSQYNENAKTFTEGDNPVWKDLCMKKFDWVRREVEQSIHKASPVSLASLSDKRAIRGDDTKSLRDHNLTLQQPGNIASEIRAEQIYEEYSASFNWRSLYHKLCFEQMLSHFDKFLDFPTFYDYVNKLGVAQEVLRIPILNKTKLKSNHYWIMVLMTKLPNLRAIKLHGNKMIHAGPDFFKFWVKGMNYMAKEGRQLQKIQVNNLMGTYASSSDYLFPVLKPHNNLVSLDFSHQSLTIEDAKALGKVLADFRQIRELNLDSANLQVNTTKEIADGLMRAKQLEILKLADNPSMGKGVSSIIYNLAFSPKIRHIDISGLLKSDGDCAEALYKLIKISGAIETLILASTGIEAYLTADFFLALGENKTLKTLNIDCQTANRRSTMVQQMAKSIAMNAYRNGALESVSIAQWMNGIAYLNTFVSSLQISVQDHENMYGDKKLAQEMEKEDLVKKMHFKLKYLNIRQSNIAGIAANYKHIMKQQKPEWPKLLKVMTMSPITLNFRKCQLRPKDMETIAYMLADNPYGESKVTHLQLCQNPIKKEGAKLLAPALKTNKSLTYLNLSSCQFGVSGMVSICESLATNTTLKSLSLYRNIFDVDGARALGKALKTNSTLEFLDLGHNRIRLTGLKSIVEGILANPASKVTELSIKWNFITDEGFSYLFDQLVLPKAGRVQQLKKLWVKNNFLSDFHKIELNKRLAEANMTGQVYVDDFEGVNLLSKEFVDRSIWIAPMPKAMLDSQAEIGRFFRNHDCGMVVDVRLGHGRTVPGRTRENVYCIVEYAHENSVPRSLKIASKKLAKFQGQPVRIYKAGTKTAVNMPSQRRRGI